MPRTRRTKKVVTGSDEYAVLNQMVGELKAQVINMPASAQDYLGATLANAYQTAYNGYAARHPGTAPMTEFLGPNSPDPTGALAVRRQVLAQPASTSWLQNNVVLLGTNNYQRFSDVFHEAHQALSQVNTLGDVQNVLYRSNLSGFLEAAVSNVKSSPQDFAASVSALSAGFVEKLPFFNRSRGTFVNYSQWNAFSEAKNYLRNEKDAASVRGSSVEGLMSGESDTFDPFFGASQVVNTGTEMAPLNPYKRNQLSVEVLPEGTIRQMELAYGKSYGPWRPNAIDLTSVGAKAGITPRQVYGSLGMLSGQQINDMADFVEAGGTLNVLDFNSMSEFNLQGGYTPVPAREMGGRPWYVNFAEKMQPGISRFGIDPGTQTRYSVGGNRTLTAQDVLEYGRVKSSYGPHTFATSEWLDATKESIGIVKRSLSATDYSVTDEYDPTMLYNDYVMSLSPEQTGRMVGQGTTVPYLKGRFTRHEPDQIGLEYGAVLKTTRPVTTTSTPSYEYRQWIQSQKYDQDTAPQMLAGQGGGRNQGSYGYWEKLKAENSADPTPLRGADSLSAADDAISLDQRYNDIVFSVNPGEDTPAIIMRKILGGATEEDTWSYDTNSGTSFALHKAIYPHPKQSPDHRAATVTAREKVLMERLNELKGLNPNMAYRASYVGKDQAGFRQSLEQIKTNYGIKGIDYTPGEEAKFAEEYYALAQENPEAAQIIASLFPDQSEKMETAVNLLKQARKQRAQATPTPARTGYTSAGDSFVTPDTDNPLARRMRAYSPGQNSRRLRGDELVNPAGQGMDLPAVPAGGGGGSNGNTPPPPPDFPDDWENYDENGNRIPSSANTPPPQNNGGNTPPSARNSYVYRTGYGPAFVENTSNNPDFAEERDLRTMNAYNGAQGPSAAEWLNRPSNTDPVRAAEIRAIQNRAIREQYGTPAERRGQRVNGSLDTTPMAAAWNRLNSVGSRMANPMSPIDRDIANYHDPLYGAGQVTQDASGRVTDRSVHIDDWVTMGNEDIMRASGAVQSTVAQALGAPMPSDPTDAMATIKQRLYSGLKKHVDEIVAGLEKTGMDPTEANEYGKRFKSLADHIAKRSFETAEGIVKTASTSATGAEVNDKAVNAVKMGALRMTDPQGIRDMMARNPQMEAAIRASNMTPEQLAALPAGEEMIMSSEGSSYLFGGSSFGGGRRNGGGGMGGAMGAFGNSSVGRMAYGAYMFGKMWQMAAGPVMDSAAQYGSFMSGIGALAGGGDVMGTDAGFGVRQSMAQLYEGRTSYQTFGAFMDIPYKLSQSDDAYGRLYATGRVSAGLAAGGMVASAMAPMLAASTGIAAVGSVGSALGPIGLAAAGTLMAGTIGMEIYNAATGSDVTYSSLFRDAEKNGLRGKAQINAAKKLDPQDYDATRAGITKYANLLIPGSTMDPFLGTSLAPGMAAQQVTGAMSDDELMKNLSPQEAYQFKYENVSPEQQEMIDASYAAATVTGEDPSAAAEGVAALKRVLGRNPTADEAEKFAKKAKSGGYSWNRYANQAASYGEQMGFVPQTPEMEGAVMGYLGASGQQRYGMNLQAQRVNSYAGMLGNYTASATTPHELARTFSNPGQAMNAQKLLSAYSSVFGSASDGTAKFLSNVGNTASPLANGMISNFLQTAGTFGMNEGRANYYGSMMAAATPQQSMYMNTVMSGDMRGMSYMQQAYGFGGPAPLYDMSGNSMAEVSGAGVVAAMSSWSGITGMPGMSAQQILGTSNTGIIDAWTQGGSRGLQDFAAQKSYEASMASAGIAMRGVALSEQFYWGSGSWDKPGAGSMWNLEDQMIALQNRSQMADFAMQEKRMTMSNDYSIKREGLDYQRMNLSQNYNLWQMDFGNQQALQQRGWTQQDWQYQDTKRGLQNQWNMEDINEAIRYSTGRDRRNLIKQRDRMAVSENLDSDQIETERGRQKEAWAAEDERYKKNREYTLQMADIEKENYNLNKKQREELYKLDQEDFKRRKEEYEEEKKLREEMQALQRKYQADQLALQKESAGLQAYAAQLQKEIADAQKNSERAWGDFLGKIQNMNTYDKLPVIMQAVLQMFGAANTVDTRKIGSVKDLFNTISGFDINKLRELEKYWEDTDK